MADKPDLLARRHVVAEILPIRPANILVLTHTPLALNERVLPLSVESDITKRLCTAVIVARKRYSRGGRFELRSLSD